MIINKYNIILQNILHDLSITATAVYVRPNTQMVIYAGLNACCPLVSHVEYAPRD